MTGQNDSLYHTNMAQEKVSITISGMPKQLRDELTRMAREERRGRSSQIVKVLEEVVFSGRARKNKPSTN